MTVIVRRDEGLIAGDPPQWPIISPAAAHCLLIKIRSHNSAGATDAQTHPDFPQALPDDVEGTVKCLPHEAQITQDEGDKWTELPSSLDLSPTIIASQMSLRGSIDSTTIPQDMRIWVDNSDNVADSMPTTVHVTLFQTKNDLLFRSRGSSWLSSKFDFTLSLTTNRLFRVCVAIR